jgi:hypothetical protein
MNAQAEQMKGFVLELVAVVGGARGNHEAVYAGEQSASARRPAAAGGGNSRRIEATKALPVPDKRANGNGTSKLGAQKTREMSPAHAIPLNDADLTDF